MLLLHYFELRSAISKIIISAQPLKLRKDSTKNINSEENNLQLLHVCHGRRNAILYPTAPSSDQERKELFKETTKVHLNFQTFTDERKSTTFLTSQNSLITEEVGHFIFHCLKKKEVRKLKLYTVI